MYKIVSKGTLYLVPPIGAKTPLLLLERILMRLVTIGSCQGFGRHCHVLVTMGVTIVTCDERHNDVRRP